MNAIGIQLASETLTRCFMDDLERGMADLVDLSEIPVIVGVPFHDEDDTLPAVVEAARKGLANAGLDGAAVVCVGSHIGGGALRKVVNGHIRGGVAVRGFLLGRGLEGRAEKRISLSCSLIFLRKKMVEMKRESGSPPTGSGGCWIRS